MSRRAAVVLLGTVAAVALIALGWWWSSRDVPEAESAAVDAPEASLPGDARRVRLYFPGLGGTLHAEERDVAATTDPEEAVRVLLAELFGGPSIPGGFGAFAVEVELGSVYVAPGGIAYVDLVSANGEPPPSSGSQQEILSVYSVVNSLVLNVSEIEAVALLWNGQQRPSFAGHVDTSRPLGARAHLIRG